MEENAPAGTSRPRRANEVGPVGSRLAINVKAMRESLALTTEQLAERVTDLGQPMRANTITKIEKGQRRVDVDDLVALAVALESRPDALLLAPTVVGTIQLTKARTVAAIDAWLWANGERPLSTPADDDGRAYAAFQTRAQPPGLGKYRFKPEELGPGLWFDGKFHPAPHSDEGTQPNDRSVQE